MPKILHVSDLHLGPAFVPAVGDALIRAAGELQPDIIVASGDFTQRAKRSQFEKARAFLDRLPPAERVLVPGNHDVPLYRVAERIFRPYHLYRKYISPELDMVLKCEDVVIVALNSTRPRSAIVNGRVSKSQLQLCAWAFQEAPRNAARIVVAHHHFAPAPDYEGGQVMPRARRGLEMLTELRVHMILGGHLHRSYVGNSLDVLPGRGRTHGIIIVQAGTATSRRGRARERDRNSFSLLRINGQSIRVTQYMYFEKEEAFLPIGRHLFPGPDREFFGKALSPRG